MGSALEQPMHHEAWHGAVHGGQHNAQQAPVAPPSPLVAKRALLIPGEVGGGQGCIRREGTSEAGLGEVAKAFGGGYCQLQMPLRLALGVRGTAGGRKLGALEGGGGTSPPSNASRLNGASVWSYVPPLVPPPHTRARTLVHTMARTRMGVRQLTHTQA